MDTTTTSATESQTGSPSTVSEREREQIERANATTATPVIFIHGLWLLPSSWDPWAAYFEEAGYVALTPDWPDDPATVEEARANPDALARKTLKQVADHTIQVINALDKKPVLIGHSTGGLLAEMIAGRGLSAVTVAIDPGVFRGVLPLPFSVLKGVGPFLLTHARAAGRSRSPSTSSSTAGRTPWTSRRGGSSTTPTTSPAPGSLSLRWETRTSTRGPRRRWTRRTPTAVRC